MTAMQSRSVALMSVSLLLGCALVLGASSARADPQPTVGLTAGVAGTGYDRHLWSSTAFHLGLHGDVMLGRSNNDDFGVGPYLEVLTNGFREIQFGGGISGLLPVTHSVPLVVSLGAYGRKGFDPLPLASFPLEPGLTAQLFAGSRSYNYHADYEMTAGLMVQMRYGLGASRETSIVLGAQVDLAILSLPFAFLINAIRGGSPATAPVQSLPSQPTPAEPSPATLPTPSDGAARR
jgi:hypothetical protein